MLPLLIYHKVAEDATRMISYPGAVGAHWRGRLKVGRCGANLRCVHIFVAYTDATHFRKCVAHIFLTNTLVDEPGSRSHGSAEPVMT